jgi:hypothetical protein
MLKDGKYDPKINLKYIHTFQEIETLNLSDELIVMANSTKGISFSLQTSGLNILSKGLGVLAIGGGIHEVVQASSKNDYLNMSVGAYHTGLAVYSLYAADPRLPLALAFAEISIRQAIHLYDQYNTLFDHPSIQRLDYELNYWSSPSRVHQIWY